MTDQEILNQIIKVEKAKELTLLGFKHFNNNDLNGALLHANNALELNPKNVLALHLRALSQCRLIADSGVLPPNSEVQMRETILDLVQSANYVDEILRISQTATSALISQHRE